MLSNMVNIPSFEPGQRVLNYIFFIYLLAFKILNNKTKNLTLPNLCPAIVSIFHLN